VTGATRFAGDDRLGYRRSATPFAPGAALAMDASYRLAHLPLVAPDHPKVIARRADRPAYDMGRHPRVESLVLPVPGAALFASPAWRAMQDELRASPLAAKLAWDVLDRRRDVLHATVCRTAALARDELDAALHAIGPFAVELRGLFSGSVNHGRLYLKVHPELRDGVDMLQQVQRSCGCDVGDLWVAGVHNLVDDLDAAETAALAALIDRWWDRVVLRFELRELWMLGAVDDLVLEAPTIERLKLCKTRG
jgi:hypothetical protein